MKTCCLDVGSLVALLKVSHGPAAPGEPKEGSVKAAQRQKVAAEEHQRPGRTNSTKPQNAKY